MPSTLSFISIRATSNYDVERGWNGHKWAQPSETHLREIMRHVYLNREEVMQKGKVAREDMTRFRMMVQS